VAVYTGGGATVIMDPPPVVYVKVFHEGSGPARHLKKKATAVAVMAKTIAPKRSGFMAASIAVDQNRTELGRYTFGYKVYTPVYYGYFVHEGTAPHIMSKFPGSYRFPGTNAYFGQMIFTEVVRHPGNSAQPFLQDALIAMA
jgi:hypothetical protein